MILESKLSCICQLWHSWHLPLEHLVQMAFRDQTLEYVSCENENAFQEYKKKFVCSNNPIMLGFGSGAAFRVLCYMDIHDFSYQMPCCSSLYCCFLKKIAKPVMVATIKCIYDRMVCNILVFMALPFLHTAEQMKDKKSAKGFLFLIFLSQHNAECSAMCMILGIPKSGDIKSS